LLKYEIRNHLNTSIIKSIDISEEALIQAKENAKINEIDEQIEFIKKDILHITESDLQQKYDVIVSNPPYIDANEYENLQKEITEYEPRNALTDEAKGFRFYEHITSVSDKFLKKGGYLFFELGIGQSIKVKDYFESNNFCNIQIVKDYLDIDRVIYGEKL